MTSREFSTELRYWLANIKENYDTQRLKGIMVFQDWFNQMKLEKSIKHDRKMLLIIMKKLYITNTQP